MTPLAHALTLELTKKRKHRIFDDSRGIMSRMDDIHCFECSAVHEMAMDLGQRLRDERQSGQGDLLAFLPAPRTWIETTIGLTQDRVGWHIEQRDGDDFAVVTGVFRRLSPWRFYLPLRGSAELARCTIGTDDAGDDEHNEINGYIADTLYAYLAMINTPRIIGRRQHMPHVGLQKRLISGQAVVGKFPLRAWTEITLEVRPPQIDEGEAHEAHLTGRRALHFCRSHLRVRLGTLEIVRAHWRGDAALGIKQSRYNVVPSPEMR